VQVSGFRVWGAGCRVYGSGFRGKTRSRAAAASAAELASVSAPARSVILWRHAISWLAGHLLPHTN
jgi:hypothetical protein